jgi:hypothetical protein
MISRLLNRLHKPTYHRWLGFKKSYVGSTDYTHSQWVATIFWIASTIVHIILDPIDIPYVDAPNIPIIPSSFIADYFFQVSLAGIALLSLLVIFPIKHGRKEWPFLFTFDWYPLAWETEVHKEKERGHLRLVREGKMQIVVPFELTGKVNKYRFELHTSSDHIRFKADQDKSSSDQSVSVGREIITCEDPQHDQYINIFEVEREGDLGGGSNHWIKIIDTGDHMDNNGDSVDGKLGDTGEDASGREVMHIDVRE